MNSRIKKPRDQRRRVALCIASVVAGGAVLAIAYLWVFGNRPRAPALRPEPVYRNAREGFRFIAPDGWTLVAKADLPAGPAEAERMLVRYQTTTGDKPGAMEVTLIDLPKSADLAAHVSSPSFGVSDWNPASPPEQITIQNVAATRFVFRSGDTMKETVAFRRGGRVYFFTIISSATGNRPRDLARKAIESVVWTK